MENIKLDPEIVEFDVQIEGIKPFLMNSPRGITSEKKGRKNSSDDKQYELCFYRNEKNEVVIPGINILASMKSIASDYIVGGKGKKTYKTYIYSGLEVTPENPLMIYEKIEKDLRPVVIGTARVIKARPKFPKWSINFTLRVTDPLLLDSNNGGTILKEILESAGKYKGLGDFRPLFGTYRVTKFEEIKSP